MRNLVLLIDTNILLNYITNREDPYLEQSLVTFREVFFVNKVHSNHFIFRQSVVKNIYCHFFQKIHFLFKLL